MTDCPECGAIMNYHLGTYECPDCGFTIEEDEFERVSIFGDDDDMPEGCAACGGDYPDCADSCPMFDD